MSQDFEKSMTLLVVLVAKPDEIEITTEIQHMAAPSLNSDFWCLEKARMLRNGLHAFSRHDLNFYTRICWLWRFLTWCLFFSNGRCRKRLFKWVFPKHHSPVLRSQGSTKVLVGHKLWTICDVCVPTKICFESGLQNNKPTCFLSFTSGGSSSSMFLNWGHRASPFFLGGMRGVSSVILCWHTDITMWSNYAGYPCLRGHA